MTNEQTTPDAMRSCTWAGFLGFQDMLSAVELDVFTTLAVASGEVHQPGRPGHPYQRRLGSLVDTKITRR